MKKLWRILFGSEGFGPQEPSKKEPVAPAPPKPKRLQLKDVKPGQFIRIEWHRILGRIGWIKCINNDPETKKIFLEMKWGNYKVAKCPQYEQIILNYSDSELANFHLLNSAKPISSETLDIDDNDIYTLQKAMNEALDKEEYETANELQKKIDKLLKK